MSVSAIESRTIDYTTQTKEQKIIPIGQLLQEAGLISAHQLKLALHTQTISGNDKLRLGEIFALKNWVPQETCDFFAFRWHKVIAAARASQSKGKIGGYLYEANLLTREQVSIIRQQQKEQKKFFGEIAVSLGFLKQKTLDFFIENLCSDKGTKSHVDSHLDRAQHYIEINDVQGVILELREALKLEPSHHKCNAWLAKIYLERQQISLAKVYLHKAIAVNPTDSFVQGIHQQFSMAVSSKFLKKSLNHS